MLQKSNHCHKFSHAKPKSTKETRMAQIERDCYENGIFKILKLMPFQ